MVERELADELGVSRVPVREALKALVAEGLVMPRPRTWAVVREFSPRDVADVLEAFGELGISWTTVALAGTAPLPWREMLGHGVALGLGTDGIRDLWSPYGDGDMLRIALDFARLHGVRFDEDFVEVARLATSSGGRFVHRPTHDLVVGARADLVIIDAENVPDAPRGSPGPGDRCRARRGQRRRGDDLIAGVIRNVRWQMSATVRLAATRATIAALTLAIAATRNNAIDAARLLLDAGADPNAKDSPGLPTTSRP